MFRVLTKEEGLEYERQVDDFLLSLDWNIKYRIRDLIEPILKQTECLLHDWVDTDSYENELSKNSLYCRKCNLWKKKS